MEQLILNNNNTTVTKTSPLQIKYLIKELKLHKIPHTEIAILYVHFVLSFILFRHVSI
jgi:hypothetical protein